MTDKTKIEHQKEVVKKVRRGEPVTVVNNVVNNHRTIMTSEANRDMANITLAESQRDLLKAMRDQWTEHTEMYRILGAAHDEIDKRVRAWPGSPIR